MRKRDGKLQKITLKENYGENKMDIRQINTVLGWLKNITALPNWMATPIAQPDITSIKNGLIRISHDIEKEYPFFAQELFIQKDAMFFGYGNVNPVVLGQTIEILKALQSIKRPVQDAQWELIHPQITKVSQKLFADGHYSNAACDAFIEINDRVKKIYKAHHPDAVELPDGQTLMNKVFADKEPVLKVCDLSDETGKNMQAGTRFMLTGAMAALRNPKAHANIELEKEDAMRRITFASLLMYKIDEAEHFTSGKQKQQHG